MILNREALLDMFKPKLVSEELAPGRVVMLRELDVEQVQLARDEQKKAEAEAGEGGAVPFGVRLLSWTLSDQEGQRLLKPEDVEKLRKSGNQHIERLIGKVLELNGFLKVPEKNSEATKSVASSAD